MARPKPVPTRQGKTTPARVRIPRALITVSLLTAGSLVAWALHRAAGEPVRSLQASEPLATRAAPPPQVVPVRSRAPAATPVPAHGAQPAQQAPEDQHRAEQVRTMVGMARAQIQRSVRMLGDRPETAANHAWPYFQGWIDAVLAIDPNLADAMSDDFDAVLCDAATTGAEKIVVLRLAAEEPMFATQRGLGCVISSHVAEMNEDVVLWAGLEAWQAAKLPVSPELERLTSASNEQRTLRRLAAIRGESPLAGLAPGLAEGPVIAEPEMSDPPPQAQATGSQL